MPQAHIENSDSTEYTVKEKALEEGTKLRYDAMKHLTTLSTGSILLIVAFLEKLFTAPKWKGLIVLAFISFTLSIVTAFFAMVVLATSVVRLGKFENYTPIAYNYMLPMIIFLVGIVSLVIFAVRNLF